jgi:hypothetical protein
MGMMMMTEEQEQAPAQNPSPSPSPAQQQVQAPAQNPSPAPSPSPSPAQQQAAQHEKPVTYGDVFSGIPADLASEPIKPRDAALMQSAETVGLGQVVKGGPAAAMQSAAAHNVNAGLVDVNSQTTTTPAQAQQQQEPQQQQQQQQQQGQLREREERAVTYGDVFSGVRGELASEPIKPKDASSMQRVETVGLGQVVKGGPAAAMQSAAAHNVNAGLVDVNSQTTTTPVAAQHQEQLQEQEGRPVTYGDVFSGAPSELASEPIKPRDAASMQSAETVGLGRVVKGGPAATMQSAAAHNVNAGLVDVNSQTTTTPAQAQQQQEQQQQQQGQLREREERAVTYGDVFSGVPPKLASEPIKPRDAASMQSVETVGLGQVLKGGPAATMQSAAAHNVNAGLVDVNSQTAATTPVAAQQQEQLQEQEGRPVTYGDVFSGVRGELASEPIKPKDASLMQSVETVGLGQVRKGGPAAAMQSASAYNVNAGLVGPESPPTPSIADAGVSVTETFHAGGDVVRSEYVAGQPVSRSIEPPLEVGFLLSFLKVHPS